MSFFQKVYWVVCRIPRGRVVTYGEIARKLGTRDARKVGWALHANKDGKVPCHRVVSKEGELAENFSFTGYKEQKRRLAEEGVTFCDERRVDLSRHEYFLK